jgi:hypothetical protein
VVAILVALAAIGAVFLAGVRGLLPGTFPVMVVLGPLLVAQYLIWIRVSGQERTTAQYLGEDPLPVARTAAVRSVPVLKDRAAPPVDA